MFTVKIERELAYVYDISMGPKRDERERGVALTPITYTPSPLLPLSMEKLRKEETNIDDLTEYLKGSHL